MREAGSPVLRIKRLGVCDYTPVWRDMQAYNTGRDRESEDQLWLLQHAPIFTLGMNGKAEHVLAPGDIPVIAIDRGGQVTYHGPGQLVAYVQFDLRRLRIGVRQLVEILEQSVIDWLAQCGVSAHRRRDAPGVYVDGAKIAALGLRIKGGCSYHGLSLNVNMDLEPFTRINPCGYENLQVTQLADLGIPRSVDEVAREWLPCLVSQLDYAACIES